MDWQHTNFKIFCFFWSIKHGCWNDIYNIDYKYICKDSKNKGPSSLRSMVPCHPDQAQTIEFVERGKIKSRCNSKQSPSLRSWSLSNRLLWMKQQLGIKSTLSKSEGQLFVLNIVQVYIKILIILFYALRAFSRFIIPLSSGGFPSFYIPFQGIPTLHLYVKWHFSRYLSHQDSAEGGRKGS